MLLYEFSDDFTVGQELHDNLNPNPSFHKISLMFAAELTATGMRIAHASIYEISWIVISGQWEQIKI